MSSNIHPASFNIVSNIKYNMKDTHPAYINSNFQYGGNDVFYKKYIKYKNKYINLIKNMKIKNYIQYTQSA